MGIKITITTEPDSLATYIVKSKGRGGTIAANDRETALDLVNKTIDRMTSETPTPESSTEE